MDKPTALLSRPTVARVCIKVDVSKPLKHRLWVGDEKDGYWQDVVFENPPTYCGFYQALGHEEKFCYFKNPSLKSEQGKKKKGENHPDISVQEKQKGKDKEKTAVAWKNKVKEDLLPKKSNEEKWTVVQRKNHKPVDQNPQLLVSGTAGEMDAAEVSKIKPPLLAPVLSPKGKPSIVGIPPVAVGKEKKENEMVNPEEEERSLTCGLVRKSASNLQGKVVKSTGMEMPAISQSGALSDKPRIMAISLTSYPDLAKIRKKQGMFSDDLDIS